MALTQVTGDTIADNTITEQKLGAEFTTSTVIPLASGPLVDLFPGVFIDIDYWQGTDSGSVISVLFQDGQDPNIASNQLAGATFSFTGDPIGSIQPGSYIIGSNQASAFGPGLWTMEFVLNPTEQTAPSNVGYPFPIIAASFLQASQVPTIDFSLAQVFTKTLTANENIVFTNYTTGAVKDLVVTGDFTLGFTTGTVNIAAGEYDGTVSNLIQVICVDDVTPTFWVTISQPQI